MMAFDVRANRCRLPTLAGGGPQLRRHAQQLAIPVRSI